MVTRNKKNSLETQAAYIEICMLPWNLLDGPKHWGSFLNNMACSEAMHYLEVIFMLFWMK